MKKFFLQVSVGLVLGVGIIVLAPTEAHAETPCPKEPTPTVSCDTSENVCFLSTAYPLGSHCFDTDGDCTPDTSYNGMLVELTCYPNGGGQGTICYEQHYTPNGSLCA